MILSNIFVKFQVNNNEPVEDEATKTQTTGVDDLSADKTKVQHFNWSIPASVMAN